MGLSGRIGSVFPEPQHSCFGGFILLDETTFACSGLKSLNMFHSSSVFCRSSPLFSALVALPPASRNARTPILQLRNSLPPPVVLFCFLLNNEYYYCGSCTEICPAALWNSSVVGCFNGRFAKRTVLPNRAQLIHYSVNRRGCSSEAAAGFRRAVAPTPNTGSPYSGGRGNEIS